MTAARMPAPARLRLSDLARLAAVGLRTRKLRAALSALGIAIGVAAIVAVLGLSASSQNGLLAEIQALGTNLLTVQNGQDQGGGTAELPAAAPAMIGRLPGVTAVQDTGAVGVNAYRSPLIPAIHTNALTVDAASLALPAAAGTSIAQGAYLRRRHRREPVAVLGAAAAAYLGIDRIWASERVWAGHTWFSSVPRILKPDALVPGIDTSVLIGYPAAEQYLGFDGHPSTIFVKAQDSQVTAVENVLAATADPAAPQNVSVASPIDALTARADATAAFQGLFLGLGAVALLVGGIGIANVMVISVLERRGEIGLRRALGARRAHIGAQFVAEAALLAVCGGAAGAAASTLATAIYAHAKGWATVIPLEA